MLSETPVAAVSQQRVLSGTCCCTQKPAKSCCSSRLEGESSSHRMRTPRREVCQCGPEEVLIVMVPPEPRVQDRLDIHPQSAWVDEVLAISSEHIDLLAIAPRRRPQGRHAAEPTLTGIVIARQGFAFSCNLPAHSAQRGLAESWGYPCRTTSKTGAGFTLIETPRRDCNHCHSGGTHSSGRPASS